MSYSGFDVACAVFLTALVVGIITGVFVDIAGKTPGEFTTCNQVYEGKLTCTTRTVSYETKEITLNDSED